MSGTALAVLLFYMIDEEGAECYCVLIFLWERLLLY